MDIRYLKRHGKILVWISLLLILISYNLGIYVCVHAKDDGSKDETVLAFTSDVHNRADNKAAARLDSWIDKLSSKDEYGKIDYMGFGGDMADGHSDVTGTAFWQYVGRIIDVMANKNIRACYTTGNHEFKNGEFHLQSYNQTIEKIKSNFIVDAVPDNVYDSDRFRIYCMGARASEDNTFKSNIYLDSQVASLRNYLNSVDNSKVIFVLTHYPLHNYNDRAITAADQVIDVLNEACSTGKKIVLLWGHNHTDRDINYNTIFKPGDIIQYNTAGDTKSILFYYTAAGCMADSEYSGGSAFVTSKGLIVTIDKNNRLNYSYYDKEGKKTFGYTEQAYAQEDESENNNGIAPNTEPYKTDPGQPTPIPEEPTPAEAAAATVYNSYPVISMEKIKTVVSIKNSTMKIDLGTFNADNCLVEYKKSEATSWKSAWTGKTGKVTLPNIKKNKLYKFRFTTFRYRSKSWRKGKTSSISYRWIKKTSGLKCSSKKKKLTVAWTALKDASGYEIQYATDKDFTKNLKKTTVSGGKKKSKVIKGLKKGKTYYVRIRTYKKKSKKYMGILTAGKKVKVK